MTSAASRLLTAFLSSLSVTLSFGLAFALDMEKPFWAGFAAMVVSMSTLGQSFQRGLLRMAGTGVGALLAMSVLSVFGETRLSLMLAMAALLTGLVLCMAVSRRSSYFYYTTALVAPAGGRAVA